MIGALAAIAATLGIAVPATAATPSSGILPGSRITLGSGAVKATAVQGNTLYLGGSIPSIGLRAAGLAATSASTGAVDLTVPELEAADATDVATASRVVADGRGGVFAFGLSSRSQSDRQLSVDGAPVGARWLRMSATGTVDRALAARFVDGDGNTARMYDVAVAPDGTSYFAGEFTKVDGQPRAGLAALAPDGSLTAWDPKTTGGVTGRLLLSGDDVVLIGGVDSALASGSNVPFTAVDGQPRAGLALVARTDGAVRGWKPAGVTNDDASVGTAVGGRNLFLASATKVLRLGLDGTGTVNDLNLRPTGVINAIASGAQNRLYVSGTFTAIGAPAVQPSRSGLAEIDTTDGSTTAWNPAVADGAASTIAVSDDAVYVGGASDGSCTTAAFRRSDASQTGWDPRLGRSSNCEAATSLVASGDRVWAAGQFQYANRQARRGYAAIDVSTDQILDWAPRSNATTTTMAVSPDGQTVYLASDGDNVNGVSRQYLAAVSATGAANTAGAVRAWDPVPDGLVSGLAVSSDGQTVYLGGAFSSVGSAARSNLAAVSATTGAATSWNPSPDGAIDALQLSPAGTLYVGGQFTHVGTSSVARRFLAAFAPGDANPTGWDPQLAPAAGGAPAIADLAIGNGVVYAAGGFDGQIGGRSRRGVAALDPTTGAATSWDAQLNGSVSTVSTTQDGTVYLIGDSTGPTPFTTAQGKPRVNLASVSAGGTVTGWSPGLQDDGSSAYAPPQYEQSNEIVEVAGRLIVPAEIATGLGFDGVPQAGFLSLGAASAPVASNPALPPVVTGKRLVDQRLTCTPGRYGGSRPLTRSYQWLVADQVVSGQTGTSYITRTGDAGKQVACRETVENAAGTLVTKSDAVLVSSGTPVSNLPPEITGSHTAGSVLSCTDGLWGNFPARYEYAWLRDGQPIAGATTASYASADGDVGHQIACQVVAINDGGRSTPARSAAVAIAAKSGPGPSDPGDRGDPGQNPGPAGPGTPTPIDPGPAKLSPIVPPVAASTVKVTKVTAARKRQVTVVVSPSAAGKVTITASLKRGKKQLTVATGRGTAKKAGTLTVTLEPTKKGRSSLRPGKTVTLTLQVSLTPTSGGPGSATKTVKLKVKR